MLLRQRTPGKLQTRCKGPYVFLRAVGRNAATLELLASDGRVRVAAAGNVIPFRSRVVEPVGAHEPRVKMQRVRLGDGSLTVAGEVGIGDELEPRGGSEWDSSDVSDSDSGPTGG